MSPENTIKSSLKQLWHNFYGYIIPPRELTVAADDSVATILTGTRERVLTAMMRISGILGIIAVAAASPLMINTGNARLVVLLAIVVSGAWILGHFRHFNYRLRAGALVSLTYFLGLIDFTTYGLTQDGRTFLFAFAIMTALFWGGQASMVALLLNVATMFTVGWRLMTGDFVVQTAILKANPPDLRGLIILTLTFLSMNAVAVVTLLAFLREYELALGRERVAIAQAEQERDLLEQRVVARTAELSLSQQEALAAQAQAEVANQAKSEFLSSMSHELRTPLNGILGYAQILRRGQADPGRAAAIIEQSGQHLLALINDVLDISRIEAKRLELHKTAVSLPIFLAGLVDIIRPRAEEKRVSFVVDIAPTLPDGVLVDEKRLRQVLLNLLGNAVKFTTQGQVILRVTQLAASSESQQATLRFDVIDSGVGMTSADLERIFRPFEQVGEWEQRQGGTGLGLTISQQLVQAMGGQIFVTSAMGQGSHFWFEIELPLIENISDSQVASKGEIVGYVGVVRTILVVDDRLENRAFFRDLLEPLGFEVVEAIDGLMALDLVKTAVPALVLTDLTMPHMDGVTLIQQLRHAWPELPILAISATVYEKNHQESLAAGANGFLPKPVDITQLMDLLATHLGLAWRYEKDEMVVEQPAKETLATVPTMDVLRRLEQLGKQGDLFEVVALVETLDQEHYASFIEQVLQFTRIFDEEGLLVFLSEQLDS